MTSREGQLFIFPFASPDRLVIGLPLMKREDAPESLADYVRRMRNELGLSLMDVERRSARGGPKIAESYISRIENGFAKNPSGDKLMALARGLGVPKEEVFDAASGGRAKSADPTMTVETDELKLLLSYRELSESAREHVLTMVNALQRSEQKKKPASKVA